MREIHTPAATGANTLSCLCALGHQPSTGGPTVLPGLIFTASKDDLSYVTISVFHSVCGVNQQCNLGNTGGKMEITERENREPPPHEKPVQRIYFYILK